MKHMDEALNGLTQALSKYWPIISFMGLQVIGYLKLQWTVANLLKNINGIGSKVNEIKETVDTNHVEGIMRSSHLIERVARIEGMLETAPYMRNSKNGLA